MKSDPTREDWKEVAQAGRDCRLRAARPWRDARRPRRRLASRPCRICRRCCDQSKRSRPGIAGAAPPAPAAVEAPAGGRGRRGGRGRGQQADPAQPAAPAPTSNSLTRYAQYEQLKRTLEAAKKYDDDWTKAEKAEAAQAAKAAADAAKASTSKQGGDKKAAAKTTSSGPRLKHDPAKDFLRKVVSGQIPLRLEAHREDDVANALRLAKELKIHLVLEGVSNPRGAGDAIVAGHIPLVLGPFADLEEASTNRIDRPNDWPKALLAGDNRWALGTYSTQPRGSRLLRVHAANAVALGIDPEKVLRAITKDAAEILGVADKLGTIEIGTDADLVAFAGDPLDPSVPVRITISGGKITYDAADAPGGLKVEKSIANKNGAAKLSKATLPLPALLPKKYALKTSRLLNESGECVPGIVVVENGKISSLGTTAPEGTPTFDLGSAVIARDWLPLTTILGCEAPSMTPPRPTPVTSARRTFLIRIIVPCASCWKAATPLRYSLQARSTWWQALLVAYAWARPILSLPTLANVSCSPPVLVKQAGQAAPARMHFRQGSAAGAGVAPRQLLVTQEAWAARFSSSIRF